MSNSEASFKAEIIKDLRAMVGIHAAVIVPMAGGMSGMPDVYVKWMAYPESIWLELKWYNRVPTKSVPVNLSPLQRAWITKHLNVGGKAGYLVGCPWGRGWKIFFGTDPRLEFLELSISAQIFRERGKPWDMIQILRYVAQRAEPINF